MYNEWTASEAAINSCCSYNSYTTNRKQAGIRNRMKKDKALLHPRSLWSVLTAALLMLSGLGTARAFTASDAALALTCYNNNFYYTLDSGAQGYYRVEDGSGSPTSFWQYAEQIELACDSGNAAMVNQLCSGFEVVNGTSWSWNAYNDDLMWASIAFDRAYTLTGNTSYLTLSENSFNTSYSRGWDTVNGGLWWNTSDDGKPSCANGPGCIAGCLLYQSTGVSTYRTEAQNIHTWEINNVYDNNTGAVMSSPGSGQYFTYDAGTFVGGAYYLGDTSRAPAAANWVQNEWGTDLQAFGYGSDAGGFDGICIRWLAKAGLKTAFLQSVVNNAWSYRNSRGLVTCCWYQRTPDLPFALYSWDCSSVVVGMLCVPPG